MSYCLQNSVLLRESDYFVKVTGRLIVKNINHFVRKAKENQFYFFPLFIRQTGFIDTRFYATPKHIYEEYFLNVYLNTRDSEGRYLETVFYDAYRENKLYKNYIGIFFSPDFLGTSGSNGIDYHYNRLKLLAKSAVNLLKIH